MGGPSIYERAGGDDAFLALATAFHARCLADPELNHPFSHPGQNPDHVARLAAYWAEVLGGPTRFSSGLSTQSAVMRLHLGNGDMTDLKQRFVVCFDRAADDAGLPEDADLRRALHDYMVWAVDDVIPAHDDPDQVPDGLPVPRWTWEGPAT